MSDHAQHDYFLKQVKTKGQQPEDEPHIKEKPRQEQLAEYPHSFPPQPEHGLTTRDHGFVYEHAQDYFLKQVKAKDRQPEDKPHVREKPRQEQLAEYPCSSSPQPKHGLTTGDRGYVYDNEGGLPSMQLNGYYPGGGNSGVTVGHGVDLAQHTREEFKRAVRAAKDVPEELRTRVEKVLDRIPDVLFATGHDHKGLHGKEVSRYMSVDTNALNLRHDEVDCLSNITFNQITTQAQKRFDRNSQTPHAFDNLSEPVKTVLVDLSYIMGSNFGQPSSNKQKQDLYQEFLEGRITKAADDLERYFPNIIGKQRAKNDAQVLRGDISLLRKESGENVCSTPSIAPKRSL
ncbi:pesticin C-terminus-like muramidase [Bombella mellum]|uniref:Pesticin C-terminal domain-containing protein n=1 Tax=Bombella mellum TaxID=2039288 RepID=A0ABR5ZST2_9PROT|nr:pesticin C-terminus-like muramidase [Bombella mellum]MBA5727302.1 hypothetical protein [Bombella mellum]